MHLTCSSRTRRAPPPGDSSTACRCTRPLGGGGGGILAQQKAYYKLPSRADTRQHGRHRAGTAGGPQVRLASGRRRGTLRACHPGLRRNISPWTTLLLSLEDSGSIVVVVVVLLEHVRSRVRVQEH